MKDLTWLDQLKLRLSYGTSGNNQGLERYQSFRLMGYGCRLYLRNFFRYRTYPVSQPASEMGKTGNVQYGCRFPFYEPFLRIVRIFPQEFKGFAFINIRLLLQTVSNRS